MVLCKQGPIQNIDDDVGLTDIYKHVVLQNLRKSVSSTFDTYDWLFLTNKDPIAYTKILDVVCTTVQVKLDLEVATSVLFCCLLIFVRNDKIVHNSFLHRQLINFSKTLTIVVLSLSRLL